MRYEIPISGHIFVEAEDDGLAEKALARWLFNWFRQNKGNAFELPDLFGDAEAPTDVVIKIDHNHVVHCPDEYHQRIMEKSRQYQEKKLAKFLRKKERDQVLAALKKPSSS